MKVVLRGLLFSSLAGDMSDNRAVASAGTEKPSSGAAGKPAVLIIGGLGMYHTRITIFIRFER